MKSLLSVNKQWNRLMEIIGTPAMVFISLSWCSYKFGINSYSMSICFALAVLFGSPNFYLAICESILGIPFLMIFREWFLKPISLPFLAKPFTWWDEQSACAGVATILFIMWMVKIVIKLSNKIAEK